MKKLLAVLLSVGTVIGLSLGFAAQEEVEEVEEAPTPAERTILQAIQEHPQLTQFHQALMLSGLTEQFPALEFVEDPVVQEYTLFVPTDAAFELMTPEERDELFADPQRLARWLEGHIIEGRYETTALGEAGMVTALTGEERAVEMVDEDAFTVNGARIIETIHADNALIHVIDTTWTPVAVDPVEPVEDPVDEDPIDEDPIDEDDDDYDDNNGM